MNDEMHCIKCGKLVFKKSIFCKKCLTKQYDLFRVKSVTVRACKSCKTYEVDKNKHWRTFKDDDEVILFLAKKSIRAAGDIKKCSFKVRGHGKKYFIDITCTGVLDVPGAKLPKTETREMVITFRRIKCDLCAKLSGNYYEAKLQLRGDNTDALLKAVHKFAGKRDITKIETKRFGHDVFIMFKKDAKRLANSLKKSRISKEIKKSYKLMREKKGKKLYRDFYAIR